MGRDDRWIVCGVQKRICRDGEGENVLVCVGRCLEVENDVRKSGLNSE